MSRSPYAPPNAPVADPPPPVIVRGKRPWPISMALLLLVAVLGNEFVHLTQGSHRLFSGTFLVVALTALIFLIERGRSWARWLLLVLTAWSWLQVSLALLAPLPAGVSNVPNLVHAIRNVTADLCLLAATILVFGPGRAWFRR